MFIGLGVFVAGDFAFIADGWDGLEIIDVSDPIAPTEVGQFDDGGDSRDVVVDILLYYMVWYNDV